MSEGEIVKRTPSLRTRESIGEDLKRLGLYEGMTVIVHSSMSSLGWVCGGPVAVIQALMDVVTPSGTIVMPTQTGDYSDPKLWESPPVPESWWDAIRETMPAYEPEITPTRGMGAIVEAFRRWPGVIRSSHPNVSFAAWGRNKETIINSHPMDNALAYDSPLGRIYDLDGWVLLIGAGYDSNTSFHLAEYDAPSPKVIELGVPVMEDGKRVWKTYKDIEFNTDAFPDIGSSFESREEVKRGQTGSADTRLFRQRAAVDFAREWLQKGV